MPYLLEDDKGRVDFETKVNEKLTPIQTAFQNNINAMYQKLVSLGSTPADKTPTAISNAIQAINDAIYNKLVSLGQTPASKTVANLNSKIQALTEIQWSQALTIGKVQTTQGDLTYRDIPINCKDVVNLTVSCLVANPVSANTGQIVWYRSNGTQISQEYLVPSGTPAGNFSKVFTPPTGAAYANITFMWSLIGTVTTGNFTLTTKYQTKVLR